MHLATYVNDGVPPTMEQISDTYQVIDPEDTIDFYSEMSDPKKAAWHAPSRGSVESLMMYRVGVILVDGMSAEQYAATTEALDRWMAGAYHKGLHSFGDPLVQANKVDRAFQPSDAQPNELVYVSSSIDHAPRDSQLPKIKAAVAGVRVSKMNVRESSVCLRTSCPKIGVKT